MVVKALLIDLDGTLADSIQCLKAIFLAFLQRHGVVGDESEFVNLAGASLHEIIRFLKDKYRLRLSHETLYQQYAEMIVKAYALDVKPMAGAAEALAAAKEKQIKLALVTSASLPLAQQFLSVQQLSSMFDLLVCAGKREQGKPDPALYLRALRELQLESNEAVAIEDSLNGVKAAFTAGCKVFWLTVVEQPMFSEQVHQIDNWKEVEKWIMAV